MNAIGLVREVCPCSLVIFTFCVVKITERKKGVCAGVIVHGIG